nr:GGDEF domain-containing protein [Azospirillum oleiclasticum]
MAHERTVSRLRRLADRDELTGLLNRRAFLHAAEGAAERARHGGDQLALVLLDLDHFKRINDEHGHLTGDRALRLAADTVTAALRTADAVGRYGGEEFCLLLPGADARTAETIAERIRCSIAAVRIDTSGGPLHLTASFGVAALGPDVSTVHELLVQADAALYAAKEQGRDRVVVAPAGNTGAALTQQLVTEP